MRSGMCRCVCRRVDCVGSWCSEFAVRADLVRCEISRDPTSSDAGDVFVPLMRHVGVVAEVTKLVLELGEVHVRHGPSPTRRTFNGPVDQLRAESFARENPFLRHVRATGGCRRTVVFVDCALPVSHIRC